MRTSTHANNPRTFRSGAYLDSLFRSAEKMDQRLQEEICARIKQARVEAGFTQEEAADTLGMTMRGYQNYESVRVPFKKLSRVAEIFGVKEAWLLRGEQRPESDVAEELERVRKSLAGLEDQVSRLADLTAQALEALAARARDETSSPPATGTDG